MNISAKSAVAVIAGILVFAALFPFSNASAASLPPSVTTISSMGVTAKQATLNATVNSNGEQTAAWFEYGPTSALGIGTSIQSVYGGPGITALHAQISNLNTGTTYYFRVAAQNKYGFSYGSIMTFVAQDSSIPMASSDPNGPRASTLTASYVYQTSANLAGTAYPNGSPTRMWFDWGQTQALGNHTLIQTTSNDSIQSMYSYVLTNLNPGTTYYYRAIAQNTYGTALGSLASFTTLGSPSNSNSNNSSGGASTAWPAPPTNSGGGIFSALFGASAKPTDPGSLTLSSELSRTQPWPGGKIEYIIHYANLGDGALSALVATVELPENLRFDSSSIPLREQNKNLLVFDLPSLRGRRDDSLTIKGIVKESAATDSDLSFKTAITYADANQKTFVKGTSINASVIAANKAPDFLALLFGGASGSVAQWFLIVSAFIVALVVYNGIRRAFTGFENKI